MAWDPVWEKLFRENAWGKYPSEPLIRFVARNFYGAPDRSAVKIFELGCGPGANMWYVAREGFSAHAVDGSPEAIARATRRLDDECPGWKGELRVGDFTRLPYPDASFDAVIDHEAVYCNSFEESQGIYAEAWRILKPGGKLFSRTFATGCVGDGTGKAAGLNAWFATEGPLAGKGMSRFTALEDIPALLGPFQQTSLEYITYSLDGRAAEVKEWLIESQKPAA